ncbi:MAG: Transcriptional activator MetR [Labilithrix sp.]|nr:Transcriptional activator MetR [Labilithrix sp.]
MGALENPVLETRHMRLVVALVDEGTTARAATRLHLTQSAVSHQLGELERRLGFPLFVREKRRLTLTPTGTELVAASRRLLTELARTEATLRARAGRTRAQVRISTECYTCYHWLPAALAAFQRENGDVDVRIALDVTRRPVAALLEGDLDVAISSRMPSGRLEGVKLFGDELVCAMAPSHPLAKRAFVTLEDFAATDLFTYDVPRDEVAWMQEKTLARALPRTITRVPLTEAIVELVRAGLGISVLARWAIEPHVRKGRLVVRPLTKRGIRRTWRALHAKNAAPHVKAFAKQIARASAEPSR